MKRPDVQRHLARFNLGEVQNLVEQTQQRTCCTVGFVGIVRLAVGQVGFLQERQHADDGVHGGANLMAHIGQKLALGLGGLLGRCGRLHHLGDVNPETHGVAIGHSALNHPQGATAIKMLDQCGLGLAVNLHAPGHPFVNAPNGRLVLAAFGSHPNNVLKPIARNHHVGAQGVDVPVVLIAQHQPVVSVKQRKGNVQSLDGPVQQFGAAAAFSFGCAAQGDVLKRAHDFCGLALYKLHAAHGMYPDGLSICADEGQFQVKAGATRHGCFYGRLYDGTRLRRVELNRLLHLGHVARFDAVDPIGLIGPEYHPGLQVNLPPAHTGHPAGTLQHGLAFAQIRFQFLKFSLCSFALGDVDADRDIFFSLAVDSNE